MKRRITLYADEGKIITNGVIYRKELLLSTGMREEDFYEITEDEYKTIIVEKEDI